MKRILLSLIAFAGVWMTAGAQVENEGYVKRTNEPVTAVVNGTNLESIVSTNGYDSGNHAIFKMNKGEYKDDKNANYINLGTNDGKDLTYILSWQSNDSKYFIDKVTRVSAFGARRKGIYAATTMAIGGGAAVTISGNGDSPADDVYVEAVANNDNGFDSFVDGVIKGGGTGAAWYAPASIYSVYINKITFTYTTGYYTLDFTKADELVTLATELYTDLSQESKASPNGNALISAKNAISDFGHRDEAVDVATGTLRAQLTTLENNLQDAINAFKLELDETVAYDKAGKTVTNITVKRNIKDGTWSPLCLPFGMEVPSGWEVRKLAKVTENNGSYLLQFDSVESIEAGKPYIVKIEGGISEIEYGNAGGFTLVQDPLNTTVEDVVFCGAYSSMSIPSEAGNYIIQGNKFHYVNDDKVMIKGYHGYFHVGGAAGNALSISFDDEDVTGITVVNGSDNANDNLYNIAGQRVNENAKGIIIKNGRKYINK